MAVSSTSMIAAVMRPRRIHQRYLLTPLSAAAGIGPTAGRAGIAAAPDFDTFANICSNGAATLKPFGGLAALLISP